MEKRQSFRDALFELKMKDLYKYTLSVLGLHEIIGKEGLVILNEKYPDIFLDIESDIFILPIYNHYFESNVVGKWRSKLIIEYFIYKEWFDELQKSL
uniref:Transcriptional regulator n=1 Tax=Meloidogyne hapla TaxID=6305 RepID=A0A1I8B4L6_MELHA